MNAARQLLEASLPPVRRVVYAAVVAVFAAIVVVVFAQVLWRFVFNAPLSWSEELARYLQVWLIMLGAAACLRKGLHLTVDYAVHALPPRYRSGLDSLVLVIIMLFLAVVFVSGVSLILVTINQRTPALQIPIALVYLALPVGSLLMLLEAWALALAADGGADPDAGGVT